MSTYLCDNAFNTETQNFPGRLLYKSYSDLNALSQTGRRQLVTFTESGFNPVI